jgi:hypothetical protein
MKFSLIANERITLDVNSHLISWHRGHISDLIPLGGCLHLQRRGTDRSVWLMVSQTSPWIGTAAQDGNS